MVYPGAAAGGMPYGMMMQPYGYVPMRPGQVRTARAVVAHLLCPAKGMLECWRVEAYTWCKLGRCTACLLLLPPH